LDLFGNNFAKYISVWQSEIDNNTDYIKKILVKAHAIYPVLYKLAL